MTTRRELLAAFAGTNARFLRHRRGADNRAENHRRDTRGEKARYVSGLNSWAPLWGPVCERYLKEAATPELLDSCSLEPSRVPWENQCRFPDPGVALRIGHLAERGLFKHNPQLESQVSNLKRLTANQSGR